MKKIALLLAVLLIPTFASAQPAAAPQMILDEATKDVCNKAILNIYDGIMSAKERYKELESFDESALTKNQYGIFEIKYENPNYTGIRQGTYYQFALTIVGTNDAPYKVLNTKPIDMSFPVLGLKFTGYQNRSTIRGARFDPTILVEKEGQAVYDHQQKYMTVKLILKPNKTIYKVNERINFLVTLQNNGSQDFKVKPLGEQTLFFTIDNKIWGTQPEKIKPEDEKKEIILRAKSATNREFKGDSFKEPREVEVRGTYNRAFKGVLPMGIVKITIVKE